jgi:hypothetical protein
MSAIVISVGRHLAGPTRVRPTGAIQALTHCWNWRG